MKKVQIIRTVFHYDLDKRKPYKVSERSIWNEFDNEYDAQMFLTATANRGWSRGYKTRLDDMFVFIVKNVQTSIKFQIVENNGSRKHQPHRKVRPMHVR